MMADKIHAVSEVKIKDVEVTVVCACGWESDPGPNETTARADFDVHLQEVAAETT